LVGYDNTIRNSFGFEMMPSLRSAL